MNRVINNSIASLNGFLQENMRGDEQRYALRHDEQGELNRCIHVVNNSDERFSMNMISSVSPQ